LGLPLLSILYFKSKAESVSLDLKTGLADIKGRKKKPIHFRFEIEDRQ